MSTLPLHKTRNQRSPHNALITEAYRAQCTELHQTTNWGVSGQKFAAMAGHLALTHECESILDYGCGKRTLEQALGYAINNYDPGIPECAERPKPADLLVSTDVLEHIEPELLDNVLDDMRVLSKRLVFLTVATFPAVRHLPDGRNAHLIIRPYTWWLPQLWKRWRMLSCGVESKRFIFIGR